MYTKKILVTTTTFPSFLEGDSIPPFIYELSKKLAKNDDFKIIISTPYIKNSKKLEERDNLKIYRYKYGFTSLRNGAILPNIKKNKLLILQLPFLLFFSFISLIKLAKKEKINIIHAHWIVPQAFLAVLYKKIFLKKDLKIICTIHGSDIFELRGWLMTKIKKWTLDNVNCITVVSKEVMKEVKALEIKNIPIILASMGVDDEIFNSENNKSIKEKYIINNPLILSVGRLVEKKGVNFSILAIKEVVKKYPNVKLLIIGDGPLKNNLELLSKKLSLEKNIFFLGGVAHEKLSEYYKSADIFISSSLSEGFGLTFVESMLCKCPVIGPSLNSVSDIIKNEKTGIQVNAKNTKLFASKIIELLDNKEKRSLLAENGYKFAKNNFTWDISAKKYYDLIFDL